MLNTEIARSVGSDQYNFALNDLASTKKAWKIVFFHKPAYVAGGHAEDPDMVVMSANIFIPNNVDLVLTGHSHFYQHNQVSGLDHFVLGGGGAELDTVGGAPYVLKSVQDYNHAIIDVTPTTVHMVVYNDRGSVLDTFDLTKRPKPTRSPAPSPTAAATPTPKPVAAPTSAAVSPAPSPLPAQSSDNLALNKTIIGSDEVTATYKADNANNGSPDSYWQSASLPATLTVDLGAVQSISKVVLRLKPSWKTARTQTLAIQGSTDGSNFNIILCPAATYTFDPAAGNMVTVNFPAASVRYVRLEVTTNSVASGAQIGEIEAYK